MPPGFEGAHSADAAERNDADVEVLKKGQVRLHRKQPVEIQQRECGDGTVTASSIVQEEDEAGTQDEPAPAPPGLLEPGPDDIRTVPAADTIYTAAGSFEDLPIPPELLQVLRAFRGLIRKVQYPVAVPLGQHLLWGACRGCTAR